MDKYAVNERKPCEWSPPGAGAPRDEGSKVPADSLRDTQMAVNSDAVAGALEIHQAVKLNKDRVPGLNVVAEEMAAFFRKAQRRIPARAV